MAGVGKSDGKILFDIMLQRSSTALACFFVHGLRARWTGGGCF